MANRPRLSPVFAGGAVHSPSAPRSELLPRSWNLLALAHPEVPIQRAPRIVVVYLLFYVAEPCYTG